jgi:hypothetical protein
MDDSKQRLSLRDKIWEKRGRNPDQENVPQRRSPAQEILFRVRLPRRSRETGDCEN